VPKTFLLDTNVLIHDPDSIFHFEGAKVIIPMTVVEELDNFKKSNDSRGRNARTVSRYLDELRVHGKLSDGVPLEHGGQLRVEILLRAELPPQFRKNSKDNILKSEDGKSQSALARYDAKSKMLVALAHGNIKPWGLKPLNTEQKFALELLMSPEVEMVSLVGVPGSGKTLLALACALEQIFEEKRYRRMLVARPVIPVGRDIGYLPGSKEEKLTSWMGAIYDNLEFLLDHPESPGDTDHSVDELFESGQIVVEAVAYLRGRSLPNQFIVIDDAQNLTPHEIKTVISRVGQGSKIVLTGDPYQIDNPYLDAASTGLSNLVDKFKGQSVYGHMTFSKIERSTLAALASELL